MTVSAQQPVFTVVETKISTPETVVIEDKRSKVVKWCAQNWKAILSELIATSSLMLFGCMGSSKQPNDIPTPPMFGALTFGTVVAMNIQIFGHISGAHMNPSVTLGAVIWGSMSIPLGIMYLIVQCAGATLGFGLLNLLLSDSVTPEAMCSTLVRSDLTVWQGVGIEIVLTAALNFVNCGVWDSRNKHLADSVPVKFGLVITGLSLAGGHLTGASMNPARTLGPAIWNNTWANHWVYWLGPLAGGSLSAAFYKFIWKPNTTKGDSPEEQPLDRQ